MKVNLSFVPPGGGKTEDSITVELPEIPRQGDYISVTRKGQTGTENFIVKRTWWNIAVDGSKPAASAKEIRVECEFASSPLSNDTHERACRDYQARTGKLLKFDASMY